MGDTDAVNGTPEGDKEKAARTKLRAARDGFIASDKRGGVNGCNDPLTIVICIRYN